MKNRYFLPFIVLGALLCSCAQETGVDVPGEIKLKEILLDASLSGTKVNLNSSGLQPFWQEGDKIAVYDGDGIREFTLQSGAGTSSAVFSGSVSSGATTLSAGYPYSAATLEDGKLKYSVPSEQTASEPGADPEALVMYSAPASSMNDMYEGSAPCISSLIVYSPGSHFSKV